MQHSNVTILYMHEIRNVRSTNFVILQVRSTRHFIYYETGPANTRHIIISAQITHFQKKVCFLVSVYDKQFP